MLAFPHNRTCSATPVDSSVVDCVFQRITLPCLAHIAVEGGIHYELLAKLLFLHKYIKFQLKLFPLANPRIYQCVTVFSYTQQGVMSLRVARGSVVQNGKPRQRTGVLITDSLPYPR